MRRDGSRTRFTMIYDNQILSTFWHVLWADCTRILACSLASIPAVISGKMDWKHRGYRLFPWADRPKQLHRIHLYHSFSSTIIHRAQQKQLYQHMGRQTAYPVVILYIHINPVQFRKLLMFYDALFSVDGSITLFSWSVPVDYFENKLPFLQDSH
jgi:hypothetical protein